MDKTAVVSLILAALDAELASYARSAKAAHAEATDEQSKAENKYDTRGLEASYLAKGQSRLAAECAQAREEVERVAKRDFRGGVAVDVGALVTIELGKDIAHYFVAPRAGGTEVDSAGTPVLVITPPSPLGQQLLGKKEGESFAVKIGRTADRCSVLEVL